jgi:hypothetical protein
MSTGTRADQGSGASGPRKGPDPLGKRALFWAQAPEPPENGLRGRAPVGRHALYSNATGEPPEAGPPVDNPIADRGPIVVVCGSCGATTRVGVLDFLLFQLPVGFWLPRGSFDRRMTCPACRRRVWASVTIRRS